MVRGSWPCLLALALLPSAAHAADKGNIDRAVDKGVAYLKGIQEPGGLWPTGLSRDPGPSILIAWTLLECGVPADDPVIRRVTPLIRGAAEQVTTTYNISLCIFFLDKLGGDNDRMIQSLAVRLLTGQGANGGWSYTCRSVGDAEMKNILDGLKQRAVLKSQVEAPKVSLPGAGAGAADGPKEILDPLERHRAVNNQRGPARGNGADPQIPATPFPVRDAGDNSNTQFATLALWVARRHGMPVDEALRKVSVRFRTSQNSDGGWSYQSDPFRGNGGSTPSMTCAGLIGLAVSYAPALEKDDKLPPLDQDPIVKAGLQTLGICLGQPMGKGRVPQLAGFAVIDGGGYYFLWSMERVAVALGLETITKKDWYSWGCEIILATQHANGSWTGEWSSYHADTCFALLFLRKANVAGDLTRVLKGHVSDPGERVLTGGGVGGAALLGNKGNNTSSILSTAPKPPSNTGARPGTPDADAASLGARLAEAGPDQQNAILNQIKEGSGSAYTLALAGAIPKLEGEGQKKARAILADRLANMKATTLRGYLQFEDREVRRAAALACGMKDDKVHIPDLIPLLEDAEPLVVRAAHASLKSLSGQDFGPAPDAAREDRAKAATAWQEWWKKNGG